MDMNSSEAKKHDLSYDKIIKNTLTQSNEMTIRFINGLLGDNIPLDAPVEWLDKESVSDKHTAIVADFYPKIDGKIYAIEIEQAGSGDMALRVFKYTVGGAMLHSMTATKAELNITFPQPCVVFLRSTKSTPDYLTWNIAFFDGQKVTLKVPAIRLADLSIQEIAERNLLPIGQFYLRSFEKLTKPKVERFLATVSSLLTALQKAVHEELVPYGVGIHMQGTIREILDNIVKKSDQEVKLTMTTDIIETLPWMDYREVFAKIEERGKAEGRVEGKAEMQMEIAVNAFAKLNRNKNLTEIISTLTELGIPEPIITEARRQAESNRPRRTKKRTEPER